MNSKTMFKVFLLHFKKRLIYLAIAGGIAYVGGMLLLFIIMNIFKPDTYINLSSALMTLSLGLALVFSGIAGFTTDFFNTIKMGVTRKNYLMVTVLSYMAAVLVFTGVAAMLVRFEVWVNDAMYSGSATLEAGFEKLVSGNEVFVLLGGFAIIVLSIIVAAIMIKYGGIGLLSIYMFFIAVAFFIMPSIDKLLDEKSSNALTRFMLPISRYISGISVTVKIIIVAICALALLGVSIFWLMTEDVK